MTIELRYNCMGIGGGRRRELFRRVEVVKRMRDRKARSLLNSLPARSRVESS
jgi:hypothetical protein